jgi:hypothetical protein
MASILVLAAEWGPAITGQLREARQLLADAASWYITLPGDCRASISHAAATCFGTPPRYFPAWGWVAIGILLGFWMGVAVACLALRDFRRDVAVVQPEVARPEHLPQHTAQQLPRPLSPGLRPIPLWHAAAREALRVATDAPRRLVLQKLYDEGDAALDLLAIAGGISRREALGRILGTEIVMNNAVAWRL